MSTRVLLVDDHVLIRSGLRRAFEDDGAFEVVEEAGTVAEALALAAHHRPDVVVVDVGLPDGNGLDAVRELREVLPEVGVVVLTMHDDDHHLLAALDARASAFVAKSAPSEEVLAAARHAATTPLGFMASGLAAAVARRSDPARPRLSEREQEVLTLLGEGLTITALAARLFVSESTAKTHVARLYDKLGARNRSQALVEAVRLGLLRVAGDGRATGGGAR